MRIFNLAEELEKERKKNKELEEEIKKLKKYKKTYINETGLTHILVYRIDKAIEYIKNSFYCEPRKIIDILKGSDNNG